MMICAKTILLLTLLAFARHWYDVKAWTADYYNVTQELRSRPAVVGRVPPGGARFNTGSFGVAVRVQTTFMRVVSVDDTEMTVSLTKAMRLLWNDPDLAWTLSDWAHGPYFVELLSAEVWKPKILMINGVNDQMHVPYPETVTIDYVGNVSADFYQQIHFTCGMDLTRYPFDKQDCVVLLNVYSTTTWVRTIAEKFPFDDISIYEEFLETSSEWTIENIKAQSLYPFQPEIAHLRYTITMKRKTAYYVMFFVMPALLTSYMNTLTFIMPSECGERFSYLVSIFVSEAVFVSFCTAQMPQALESIPLVMYLLLGTMVETVAYIVVVALLLRMPKTTRSGTSIIKDDVKADDVTFTAESIAEAKAVSSEKKTALPRNSVHPMEERCARVSVETWTQKIGRSGSFAFFQRHCDSICFAASLVLNTAFVLSCLLPILY